MQEEMARKKGGNKQKNSCLGWKEEKFNEPKMILNLFRMIKLMKLETGCSSRKNVKDTREEINIEEMEIMKR